MSHYSWVSRQRVLCPKAHLTLGFFHAGFGLAGILIEMVYTLAVYKLGVSITRFLLSCLPGVLYIGTGKLALCAGWYQSSWALLFCLPMTLTSGVVAAISGSLQLTTVLNDLLPGATRWPPCITNLAEIGVAFSHAGLICCCYGDSSRREQVSNAPHVQRQNQNGVNCRSFNNEKLFIVIESSV